MNNPANARLILWKIIDMRGFLDGQRVPAHWLNLDAMESDLDTFDEQARAAIALIRENSEEDANELEGWRVQHVEETRSLLRKYRKTGSV